MHTCTTAALLLKLKLLLRPFRVLPGTTTTPSAHAGLMTHSSPTDATHLLAIEHVKLGRVNRRYSKHVLC
jgi:hypothetical protein